MPEESAEWVSYEGDSIPEEFKLSRASGFIAGPAGALWPYKFVTGVLSHLLSEYPKAFHVANHTAVRAIHTEASSSSSQPYRIENSRGTISAKHVIHCTNAHVGHFVPGLRGRIFSATKHSWLFNYDRGFDYLTQLPTGQMMFGRGFANGEGGGVGDLGIAKDDEMSVYIDIHLSGALSAVFGHKAWGPAQGNPIRAMWTGNMAFSTDGFPWVGRLPGSATGRSEHEPEKAGGKTGSEWVCAALGGEGMVQAWLCGKALGTMILKHDGQLVAAADLDLSWFPDQLLVSEKRIAEAEMPKNMPDSRRQSNL
ncbi:FAD dependent oxidoreductase [Penicillium camemberti]|uniref:FAD dependent oxidoreductase n=1 Tax=Penicillium camemberti (strain FM 013) TaxID=1429867 RepID=A0A0G4PXJ7_PENC3|nr:FAD dependent oxidoreductase [Penicillium camemberti]